MVFQAFSWICHCSGGLGVGGSNPLAPTIKPFDRNGFSRTAARKQPHFQRDGRARNGPEPHRSTHEITHARLDRGSVDVTQGDTIGLRLGC